MTTRSKGCVPTESFKNTGEAVETGEQSLRRTRKRAQGKLRFPRVAQNDAKQATKLIRGAASLLLLMRLNIRAGVTI
jgi:hypothetical protein